MKKKVNEWIVIRIWLFIVASALVTLLLCGCSTTKYIEVPAVKTDTMYQSKVVNDSIYIHDSTFVKVAGDTVYLECWHTRWRERVVTDTVHESHIDTVAVPVPVEIEKAVEREPTSWETFQLWFAKIMLAVLAFSLGLWIWKTK